MTKKAKRKLSRSGHACCDVCGSQRPLVEHHIHGRNVARWREPWNCAWLCPDCHDDTHRADLQIEGWRMTSEGRELIWREKGDNAVIGDAAKPPIYGG